MENSLLLHSFSQDTTLQKLEVLIRLMKFFRAFIRRNLMYVA